MGGVFRVRLPRHERAGREVLFESALELTAAFSSSVPSRKSFTASALSASVGALGGLLERSACARLGRDEPRRRHDDRGDERSHRASKAFVQTRASELPVGRRILTMGSRLERDRARRQAEAPSDAAEPEAVGRGARGGEAVGAALGRTSQRGRRGGRGGGHDGEAPRRSSGWSCRGAA